MSTSTHRGPWDDQSRKSQALRFIEKYFQAVDSIDRLSKPSSAFYAPVAVYHDTKGDVHITGPHIWEWIGRQLSPFSEVRNEAVEIRVIKESDGKNVVYGQFLTHFQLKGDQEDIQVPRVLIFTLGETEGEGGTEGLQIQELRLYWDTGIIGRYVTDKKKKELRKRTLEVEVIQCDTQRI